MRDDDVSGGCMRNDRGVAVQVSITPAGNGDFLLRHPASPDPLILTAEDVLSLASRLPALARQINQNRSEIEPSRLQRIAAIHLSRVMVRHDAIGEHILLELTDTVGLDMAIELHLAQARKLVASLLQACDRASTVAPEGRQ